MTIASTEARMSNAPPPASPARKATSAGTGCEAFVGAMAVPSLEKAAGGGKRKRGRQISDYHRSRATEHPGVTAFGPDVDELAVDLQQGPAHDARWIDRLF